MVDKQVYVGFSILDLSKLLMYYFHYKYIKVKFYGRSNLSFTDTDSSVYKIETDDVYEDFLILVVILKIQSFLILLIK